MAKTWEIILEGADPGTADDIQLTFFDSNEILGKATLNKRYIDDLKWNLQNKTHYNTIRNIKSIKSSAGKTLTATDVGVILATVANEDMKIGLLVKGTEKGGFELIALWPDDFARACKVRKSIYQKMVISLVQNPALFAEVSIIVP